MWMKLFSVAPISFKVGSEYVSEDSKKKKKKRIQINFFRNFFILESSETHFDLVTSKVGAKKKVLQNKNKIVLG